MSEASYTVQVYPPDEQWAGHAANASGDTVAIVKADTEKQLLALLEAEHTDKAFVEVIAPSKKLRGRVIVHFADTPDVEDDVEADADDEAGLLAAAHELAERIAEAHALTAEV